MNSITSQSNKGFAMLFTVLIVSLMLTIAIGISSITFKQNILSSLAKDSQIAFYQADAAVECGKYYDTKLRTFWHQMNPDDAPSTIECGGEDMVLDTASFDYYVYRPATVLHKPCFWVIFNKIESKVDPETGELTPIFKIRGNGYNYCDANPRQVQRSFEYIY